MSNLIHFLLVFDRSASQLLSQESFDAEGDAIAAYSKAERKYYGDENIEVVLLATDSVETLAITHGHYFSGKVQPAEYAKLLDA